MLNFLKEYWFLITFLLAQIGFLISFYKKVKQSAIDTKEATKCSLRNDILEIYDRCKEDKKITNIAPSFILDLVEILLYEQ